MSEAPLLELAGLSVDIPTEAGVLHAVRDVSLTVRRGETLCVVGESGCGKSLTSLAIMGLLPPAAQRRARRLALAGEDLLSASPRRLRALRGDRMAMIFQDPMTSLNPAWSVGDQLEEIFIRHGKGNRRAARERAVALLERVGIANAGGRLAQYPHQLSGGLRQRVMIAMALMCSPGLVLADEPTTALDATIQLGILQLLAELQAEMHMGLMLVTHDLGIVARIADRVAVMYAGEVVEEGPARTVFTAPRHPYTRGLIDCIPQPDRMAPGQRLGTIPGMVPSLVGEVQGCAFRTRCAFARPECAATVAPRHGPDDHMWRCVLPPETLDHAA
ncbi:ABC transporter ATP-binding protein [Roseomonas sp. E05]|uniref:ABC transporter ATP-binding protein n=1 Tax=Roseomonas sp. E05 TaxID=3046310 RepID=UPI0024B9B437|nr:ABC transporter ATP-binding protein [Roseomonas sp. E05]MDJ0388836.1 ABC transporter ATP-binding protein [Roseomonas sp. E05]